MKTIDIPGFGRLSPAHVVMDYNGTLAVDGKMSPGVGDRLRELSRELSLHVITADTFGVVRDALEGIACTLQILPAEKQDLAKRDYVRSLGVDQTVSIGNGRNDRLMLRESVLGIGVILGEGAFGGTLACADIVCTSILDALDLLRHPLRLTATLRS